MADTECSSMLYILMGCSLGKKKVGLQVDFDMEETGDTRFDSLFQEMETPLGKLVKTQWKLTTALQRFHKEVGTLRHLKNASFFDSLMAMLFCLSASGQGSLEAIDFQLLPEAPYLQVNTRMLYLEHRKLVPAWTKVVSLALKAPLKVAELTPLVESALTATAGTDYAALPRESEPESASSVDPFEQQKRRILASNFTKLQQAPLMLQEIAALAQDVNRTAKSLPQIMTDAQNAISAIGQRAFVDQKLAPGDIVKLYWPTAHSSPQLND